MDKEKTSMAYTMDAPHFGRKMPTKGKSYALTVADREMLRRVTTGRPVSDVTAMSPAEERARRRENHTQIGQGRYGLIQPSPEDIAEAEKREALMAAGREARKRGMERTASIVEAMKAAADKFWRRA
jgi:hypothetical protein